MRRLGAQVASFFYTLFYIISKQGEWRPFASSGLHRPSLPCDLIIDPQRGSGRGPVPLSELDHTP